MDSRGVNCQTSVGHYFDSDGYLGQEEILAEFMKLVQASIRGVSFSWFVQQLSEN